MFKIIFTTSLSFFQLLSYSQAPALVHQFAVTDDITPIIAKIKIPIVSVGESSEIITSTLYSCFNSSCGALPVELLSFDAERKSKDEVVVSWKTTNEKNNKMFIIEKSLGNTTNFKETGKKEADFFEAAIHEYTFMDENDFENTSYYRLRQIDIDARTVLSRVVPVKGYFIQETISVFPNPASTDLALNVQLRKSDNLTISLYNNQGQKVSEQNGLFKKGKNTLHLETTNFVKGMYIIKVSKSDGHHLITRFIKN